MLQNKKFSLFENRVLFIKQSWKNATWFPWKY